MFRKRLLFLMLLSMSILVFFTLPTLAATTITSVTFNCDQIKISYDSISLGPDDAAITITNLDTATIIYDAPHGSFIYSPHDSTYTISFPEQPEGSILEIRVDAGAADIESGICTSRIDYQAIAFGDGRFCFGRGETEIALFPYQESGLAIYRINLRDDTGELLFLFTGEELAEIEANPAENLLIASSADNFVLFYRLSSGQYQINVGPNYEGKVHVCIFDSIPDYFVSRYSYFVSLPE